MVDTPDEGPALAALRENVKRLESKVAQHELVLRGDPAIGLTSLRLHLEGQVKDLKEEITGQRNLIDGLVQERRDELAEKRGMKRLIRYTGITSFATLLTLFALIWNNVGGGP